VGRAVIVAALEREVHPLIKRGGWRKTRAIQATYGCYENDCALIVCAGVGGAHASRAAEEAAVAAKPVLMVSAGLAGAVLPGLAAGQVIVPATVVDAETSKPIAVTAYPAIPGVSMGGVLVSVTAVADVAGKRQLAEQYGARVIDMEAASVAKIARLHDIPFLAMKAISDEYDFALPELNRFVDGRGRFKTMRFVAHAAVRPGTWPAVEKLASNTAKASQQLCRALNLLLAFEFTGRVQAGDAAVVSNKEMEGPLR
jgi:adenosylhomocysteine nucleosidase